MKISKKSYHPINPVSDWHNPENQNAPMCKKHPFLVRFFQSNLIHNRTSSNLIVRDNRQTKNPRINWIEDNIYFER